MATDDLRWTSDSDDHWSMQLDRQVQAQLASYVADLLRRVGREPRVKPRPFGATLKAFLASAREARELSPSV